MAGDLYYRVSVTSSGASYDMSDDLSSFTIEQVEGQPDSLVVEAADPYKVLSHAIQEGMDVEAELGTDDDHAVVFRGRIYKVDGSFPAEQTPTLRLQAYDPSMRMGLRTRNRNPWAGMTLSAIVAQVAGTYFPQTDVRVTGDPTFPNGLRQQEETDLAFLLRLARTYGCVMSVAVGAASDTFRFVSQQTVMSATPTLALYYGRSDVDNRLLSFDSSADSSKIELPRVLSGIDYDTGQATELTTTDVADPDDTDDPFVSENLAALAENAPDKAGQLEQLIATAAASHATLVTDLGTAVREANPSFTSEDQQAAIANNQFSTSLFGMRGNGRSVGIRQLTAQSNITLGDVGGRFSGSWFLSQVRHVLNGQGYMCEFECRR
ncbi:MAG TPA: contractile injection system protein, VgrG/Pvc8 family [Caulobacteraceae bacterium]|nr:contractile injection system protein, VgrG/Pvc8 family [Caulobacteraceae bacterium]